MLPVHTQKSLDALTWNEIQKLHTSLGLKATAESRTRRDYQRRIVATQPQPVVEPEAVASPLTCAACPLARLIDGNRYCCGLTNNVTRGHWEANSDCYDAIAEAEAETETTETVAPITQIETAPQKIAVQPQPTIATATTTDDTPPNRGDNGRGRVEAIAPAIASSLIDDNFMTAFTQESLKERYWNDLAYLEQLEMNAQIALERTYIGSEEEKIALLHLKQIECDIEIVRQKSTQVTA